MLKIRHIVMLLITTLPFLANAHEGHDHSHWTSNLIHFAFYSCIALVFFAINKYIKKIRQLKNNKG